MEHVPEGKKGLVLKLFTYPSNSFPGEIFDEDGCYDPKNYMAVVNRFDQFQSFSDILGML